MARTLKAIGDRKVRGVAGQTIFDVKKVSRRSRNTPPQDVKAVYAKIFFPIV